MPTLSPFALALLGQLPSNDGADQEPDQDADDGDVVYLPPQEKSLLDPGEPTARTKRLLDSLIGSLPDLRRTPKPGVSMNAPNPGTADNGTQRRSILSNALLNGRVSPANVIATPDPSSDVASQLAATKARQAAQQQAVAGRANAENLGAMLPSPNDNGADLTAEPPLKFSEEPNVSTLRDAEAGKIRKSLFSALNPQRKQSFDELAETDIAEGVTPEPNGYTKQRKQSYKYNPFPMQRVPLDAQPSLISATRTPITNSIGRSSIVGDSLEPYVGGTLDPYIAVSPETQRQYHLKKYKNTSPEDAEAYLASRRENAPQEAVDQLDDWRIRDLNRKVAQNDRWDTEDRMEDRKAELRNQSRQYTKSTTQRNFLDSILGRTQPSGKSRSDELYDDTMSEFRNRQTLAGRNAGMGNSAALYAGTPRYNAKMPGFSQKPGISSPTADDEANTQAEFDANKARMADPNRERSPYVKSVNQPQNLSTELRSNIDLSRQKQAAQSADAKRGLLDAMMGLDRPVGEDGQATTTPEYERAYSVGLAKRLNNLGLQQKQAYDIAMEQARSSGMRGLNGAMNGANVARVNNANDMVKEGRANTLLAGQLRDAAAALRAKGDEAGAKKKEETAANLENQLKLANDELAGAGLAGATKPATNRNPAPLPSASLAKQKPVPIASGKAPTTKSTVAKPPLSAVDADALRAERDAINKRRRPGTRSTGGYQPYGTPEDERRAKEIAAILAAAGVK